MKIAISQSNYIPWRGYFDMINQCDCFVLYDEVQYTRRDWRNRNKIITPQGPQWLTIPVEAKGKYDQKISETLISSDDWATKHWNTIERNYKKAACFDSFGPFFASLYERGSKIKNLSELNELFITEICDVLRIDTTLRQSSEFELPDDRNDRLISICQDLGANVYLSGPAAKCYLDETQFAAKGIEVEWMTYPGYPEYQQRFGEFEGGVSIVDAILNAGNAKKKIFGS